MVIESSIPNPQDSGGDEIQKISSEMEKEPIKLQEKVEKSW